MPSPGTSSQFGQAFANPQITALESQKYNQQLNNAFLGSQQSYKDATRVFNKLEAKLAARRPRGRRAADLPSARPGCAVRRDLKAAITAYERYLE